MRQATLADEFNTLFVLHVSSLTHRRSSHCHTNYSFQFVIRFISSSHYTDLPSLSSHLVHIALGPERVGIGIDHLYVRKDFLLCILYVFLCLLLRQTSCSLFRHSLFYFGPFAISDTAPLTPLLSKHPS